MSITFGELQAEGPGGPDEASADSEQALFAHAYKVEGAPVFVASDASSDALLDDAAGRDLLADNPDLQRTLYARGYRHVLELPKFSDRIVRDARSGDNVAAPATKPVRLSREHA